MESTVAPTHPTSRLSGECNTEKRNRSYSGWFPIPHHTFVRGAPLAALSSLLSSGLDESDSGSRDRRGALLSLATARWKEEGPGQTGGEDGR